MQEMRLGAQILRASLTFNLYLRKSRSRVDAALALKRKFDDLEPRIIDALLELEPEVAGEGSSRVPHRPYSTFSPTFRKVPYGADPNSG